MLHKRRGSTRLVLWGSRRRPSQRSLPTQGLHLSPLQQPALWLQNLLPRLQQYLAWRVASLARVARLPCMQRLEHTAVAQVRSKANEVCWHKDNASASPSQAHTLRTCCQARRLRVDVVISMRVLVHLHSAPPYQGCPLLHMTAGGAPAEVPYSLPVDNDVANPGQQAAYAEGYLQHYEHYAACRSASHSAVQPTNGLAQGTQSPGGT